MIHHEIDELLTSELRQVEETLDRHPPDHRGILNWDHNLQIAPVKAGSHQSPVFSDTTLFDPIENTVVPVRMLRATHAVGHHNYAIRLHQPYVEYHEIAHYLSIGIVLCFLVLFGVLLFVETLIFRRIFQPFYKIIQQLGHYRVDQGAAVAFPASEIDEFDLLSQSLTDMTQQAALQFSRQKQFTDHTSHEFQTPLSVLSTDLDLLQQSDRLSEEDTQRLHRSQKTIKRLSSLNQSLLLLTKIDNHQYGQLEPVDVGSLIGGVIDHFGDYADSKQMRFQRSDTQPHTLLMNRQLAYILFSNLVRNAIRHGRPSSTIFIQSNAHSYRIINEGAPLPFPQEQLFQRFVRNPALAQSTGLGLAIVKEIVDQYGLKIDYTYSPPTQQHIFTLTLP
ncbi:sensor histidine kinase [Spirosoma profusum]|uniref:sensor histidine kinase n=1 Tax=Spirosoma profusum TaxID=2771354 RepID=UPI00293C0775|nr:HAMP domain-containing sensor histidine kinase [Spirosoma profusum]